MIIRVKTIKGVTFEYGENETQRYWEHITNEKTYLLLQPKLMPTYWAIIQLDSKGNCKPLNCAVVDKDGNIIQQDPLYSHHELTVEGWLEKLANYIQSTACN
jgi:hypothetical protein